MTRKSLWRDERFDARDRQKKAVVVPRVVVVRRCGPVTFCIRMAAAWYLKPIFLRQFLKPIFTAHGEKHERSRRGGAALSPPKSVSSFAHQDKTRVEACPAPKARSRVLL